MKQSNKTIKYFFVGLAVFAVWLFLRHDAFLYHNPIGQITHISEKVTQKTTDEHDNEDELTTQQLTIKLLNHDKRVIVLQNEYASSQAITTKYRVGDQLILEHVSDNTHILSLKRDAWVGALLTLFVALLMLYSNWRSASWLLLSMLANIGMFSIALLVDVHDKNANVLVIFSVLSALFATVSLLLVLGKTLQMWLTLLSTLTTTFLTMIILIVALRVTNNVGVHFETMSYVTQMPEILFMAQTVIGVLGAVMDESADIVAMQFGMHRENNQRLFSDYWQGGMSVGRDIMGTLTNVLFMIFIADTLPMVFLMLRNGNNWSYIMDQIMNLGILQTVISAIGIVLAVPVTSALVGHSLTKKAVVK